MEGSWLAIDNRPSTNTLVELNAVCEVQRQEQSVLRVQLQDATHKDAIATAMMVIPSEREIALRNNIGLANASRFERDRHVRARTARRSNHFLRR